MNTDEPDAEPTFAGKILDWEIRVMFADGRVLATGPATLEKVYEIVRRGGEAKVWADDEHIYHLESTTTTLEHVRNLNPFQLGLLAECSEPESQGTVGAQFLMEVQLAVIDTVQRGMPDDDSTQEIARRIAREVLHIDIERRWEEFVELEGYKERLELQLMSMDEIPGLCLQRIAERLALALFGMLTEEEK